MDSQFDKSRPLFVDPNKEYEYKYPANKHLVTRKCKGWTVLMRKVVEKPSDLDQHFDTDISIVYDIVKKDPTILSRQNEHGMTALMLSCCFRISNMYTREYYWNQKITKLLVKLCCDVDKSILDIQDNDGETALILVSLAVSTTSRIHTAKLLISSGCNIFLKNNKGRMVMDRDIYHDVFIYISQIVINNNLRMSSLMNVCCEYIKNNQGPILKHCLRRMVIKDVFNKLVEYGALKKLINRPII